MQAEPGLGKWANEIADRRQRREAEEKGQRGAKSD
jgi:hypothetical protein